MTQQSAATVLHGAEGVWAAVGRRLGESDWLTVTADRLTRFDEATSGAGLDWFVVSISNLFLPQIVEVTGFAMGVNLGTENIAFLERPTAGTRLRGTAKLVEAGEVKNSLQTRMQILIEDDAGTVYCVIDSLSRWFP